MGGRVQQGGAWAGCGPTLSPPRCTKSNSPPVYQSVYCCIMVRCSVVLMCPSRVNRQTCLLDSAACCSSITICCSSLAHLCDKLSLSSCSSRQVSFNNKYCNTECQQILSLTCDILRLLGSVTVQVQKCNSLKLLKTN